MRKNWKKGAALFVAAAMVTGSGQAVSAAETDAESTKTVEASEVVTSETGEQYESEPTGTANQADSLIQITGFDKLSTEDSYVETENEEAIPTIVADFPAALDVYIEGAEDMVSIDVTWENTYTYEMETVTFYEYRPEWDTEQYGLAESVDEAADVPKIIVALRDPDKKVDLSDDPEYEKTDEDTDEDSSSMQFYRGANLTSDTYVHNSKFDDCVVIDGIDVSKYQAYIDWSAVKAAGVEFAIIRVGYRGTSTGVLQEDEYYQINIQGALDAGLKVGVYIFSQATTTAEAEEEADYILSRISSYNITLPVVIDYEYASGGTGRLYEANLSVDAATSVCNSFCAKVTAAGYTAMVYANKNMLQNHLNASAISSNYQIWLANYTTETSYSGDYDFWQYSSKGSVDGISGNVDCDFWYCPKYSQTIADGVYTISTALDDSLVLDVDYGSTENGANVALCYRNGSSAQEFVVEYVGDGKYAISVRCSDKMLDVEGGGGTAGTNVSQYEDNGYDTQRWYIQDAGDGYYYLISCWNGLYLDVSGGIASTGTNIQLWSSTNGAAQKFKFAKTGMSLGSDGQWYYYTNGSVDTSYTGMARNGYGGWYMTNGTVNWNYTGMACNEYGWWYMTNGVMDLNYTGMASNEYGWWYMTNGVLDLSYTGTATNEYGEWYFVDGVLVG